MKCWGSTSQRLLKRRHPGLMVKKPTLTLQGVPANVIGSLFDEFAARRYGGKRRRRIVQPSTPSDVVDDRRDPHETGAQVLAEKDKVGHPRARRFDSNKPLTHLEWCAFVRRKAREREERRRVAAGIKKLRASSAFRAFSVSGHRLIGFTADVAHGAEASVITVSTGYGLTPGFSATGFVETVKELAITRIPFLATTSALLRLFRVDKHLEGDCGFCGAHSALLSCPQYMVLQFRHVLDYLDDLLVSARANGMSLELVGRAVSAIAPFARRFVRDSKFIVRQRVRYSLRFATFLLLKFGAPFWAVAILSNSADVDRLAGYWLGSLECEDPAMSFDLFSRYAHGLYARGRTREAIYSFPIDGRVFDEDEIEHRLVRVSVLFGDLADLNPMVLGDSVLARFSGKFKYPDLRPIDEVVGVFKPTKAMKAYLEDWESFFLDLPTLDLDKFFGLTTRT